MPVPLLVIATVPDEGKMLSYPLATTTAKLVRGATRFRPPFAASVRQVSVSNRVQIAPGPSLLSSSSSSVKVNGAIAGTSKELRPRYFHSTSLFPQNEIGLNVRVLVWGYHIFLLIIVC